MNLQEYMRSRASLVESALDRYLPPTDQYPSVIHESMRYSTLNGGKRLRAILAMAACEAVGGNYEKALGYAAAIEMIHAYSLVHDDLPCMDDDDMRRGKPTNHKVFGEAIAVLAGDALLTHAFNVIASLRQELPADTVVRLVEELSKAGGSLGLIGGQVVDLQSEGKEVEAATVEYIHQHKTGALFEAALRGGALIGGATEEQLAALTTYAREFGLAFQVTDDILDIVGDAATLGKATGSDARAQKSTYPSIYGLEEAKRMAEASVRRCEEIAQSLPTQGEVLAALARFVLQRDH